MFSSKMATLLISYSEGTIEQSHAYIKLCRKSLREEVNWLLSLQHSLAQISEKLCIHLVSY